MIGADRLTISIEDVVHRLTLTDLAPSPQVDALFSSLVGAAAAAGGDHPLIHEPAGLALCRQVCAAGETKLEEFWARRILAEPAQLQHFPYLANYRHLARSEHLALSRTLAQLSGRALRHIVFAGCGPLPLTAIALGELEPSLRITCLDVDPAAAATARRIGALLAPGRIDVVAADARDHTYRGVDAVLVAALVGETPAEKLGLLRAVAAGLEPGVLLAARSVPADGRQLLYARLEPAGLAVSELEVIGEWLPPAGVINSLLLLRPV